MLTVSILTIFIGLMKNHFSHIFRSLTISVLMTGLLAHLLLPFSTQVQKTAFTQWLDQKVVESGNENEGKLRDTIRQLPEKSADFWILVQEASELISNNKDDFQLNFAFGDENENHHVTSWLVGQWNLFHYQQSATNAVLPELTQQFTKWISLPSISGNLLPGSDQPLDLRDGYHISLGELLPINRTIIPLVNSISINAP